MRTAAKLAGVVGLIYLIAFLSSLEQSWWVAPTGLVAVLSTAALIGWLIADWMEGM